MTATIYLDVIYMAEFTAKNLLYDMTPYLTPARRADFDDQMIESAQHNGKLWGVPKQRDVGVLYYRADLETPPLSWQDVYRHAKRGYGQHKPKRCNRAVDRPESPLFVDEE